MAECLDTAALRSVNDELQAEIGRLKAAAEEEKKAVLPEEPPRTSFDQMPPVEMRIFARSLIAAAEQFYEDPANEARFDAWIKSPEGRAYLRRQAQRENGSAK